MKKIIIILLLPFMSCSFQADKLNEDTGINKYEDKTQREIAAWKDQRETDSLLMMLRMGDEEYQYSAATALASVQDTLAISTLTEYLSHDSEKVRRAVGYALGQMYNTSAFSGLMDRISIEPDPRVLSALLEAAGKNVDFNSLSQLTNYTPQSALATQGLMWGLYRAGIKNIFNDTTTRIAVNILDTALTKDAQLAAAHYLARTGFSELPSNAFEVLNKDYKDPDVRMAVVSAFRKAPYLYIAKNLPKFFEDPDYRIRINAVRAIPDEKIRNYLKAFDSLLTSKNVNTSIATSQKLLSNIRFLSKEDIEKWLNLNINWRTRAILLEAALKKEPDNTALLEQVKANYASSQNPYEKAALLQALSHSITAYDFIITETFKNKNKAISTAGISSLASMRQNDNFPMELNEVFIDVFKQAINSGDAALIDIVSTVLRDPHLNFKKSITDYRFLLSAKGKLKLPKENETLQSLEKAIAYFEGRNPVPVNNTYNNPINWKVLDNIQTRHEAIIETSKGKIKINLFTNEAPGTVANFIELAQKGYFNNKTFHRVVPNFVVQGGGNRGDGYGSEDYSIRSEFADLKYLTGTLGMASAGKDTEGTQWFITHSPTPHLDGRYSIFARITEGWEVLHHLEQGDKIQNVKIN